MLRRRSILVATLCLALSACGSLIPAGHQTTDTAKLQKGNFRLDPDHTTVLFKANHLGFSTYVGRFNAISGSLDFDPASPAQAKLQTSIDVASVDTPSGDLDEILRGPDWLNAERFPTARFESRSITVTSPTTGMITGDLTLHGVTAPITLEVTFRGGADNLLTGFYTLGFEAKSTFTRSTFGIGSLIPAIADTVTLEIHAEFQRIDG
jgi:polyisoprenoid-binding protein YceI